MTEKQSDCGDAPDEPTDQRTHVRQTYGDIAASDADGCGCGTDAFDSAPATDPDHALSLGYDPDDLETAPADANLGLGCGNPVAISRLEVHEFVHNLTLRHPSFYRDRVKDQRDMIGRL